MNIRELFGLRPSRKQMIKKIIELEDQIASLKEVIEIQNKFGPSSMSDFWQKHPWFNSIEAIEEMDWIKNKYFELVGQCRHESTYVLDADESRVYSCKKCGISMGKLSKKMLSLMGEEKRECIMAQYPELVAHIKRL